MGKILCTRLVLFVPNLQDGELAERADAPAAGQAEDREAAGGLAHPPPLV